jgi:hypothetical protein
MELKVGRKYKNNRQIRFYSIIDEINQQEVKYTIYYHHSDTRYMKNCRTIEGFSERYDLMYKKVKPTALARKLHPDAEIEDGWMIIYEL